MRTPRGIVTVFDAWATLVNVATTRVRGGEVGMGLLEFARVTDVPTKPARGASEAAGVFSPPAFSLAAITAISKTPKYKVGKGRRGFYRVVGVRIFSP